MVLFICLILVSEGKYRFGSQLGRSTKYETTRRNLLFFLRAIPLSRLLANCVYYCIAAIIDAGVITVAPYWDRLGNKPSCVSESLESNMLLRVLTQNRIGVRARLSLDPRFRPQYMSQKYLMPQILELTENA